jgi:hypothetical protein
MAEIHVQARKHHQQANPSWMWLWIVLGIIIIAAVVYFIYANKNNNNPNNTQQIENSRNTPQPGAMMLQDFSNTTYVMRATA